MDKNRILIAGVVVAAVIFGIAQTGNPDLITGMMGYNMSKAYHPGFILGIAVIKLLVISLVSLIFSVIFWETHKWVMKKKR